MPARYSLVPRWRDQAFKRQSGRCYYCDLPMCNSDVRTFASVHGLSTRQAELRRCTAEHLRARRDGGRDSRANIVAACLICNRRRHARATPLDPLPYRQLVQERLAGGGWHVHMARPS
jgi:hypothetical protein